ncbi:MAG: hypothetical protein E6Q97_29235 [Desulfurellales bacterium]|nr:MAG: hypothetical protein E6Q97_29235 [Desulfurellales bacterium]
MKYLGRLAALGCIACRKMGYEDSGAEIHHIRETVGMGQRAGHDEAIPLCPAHHRGTHHPHVPSIHLARREFIARFGTELELLAEVRKAIGHCK